MDASEEILAVLREIRDQQRRQIELYGAWRADTVEPQREWREEWSRQAEIYRILSARYLDSNQLYVDSAKGYIEANPLYIHSMKRAKWSGPVVLIGLLAIIFAATRS